MKKIVCEQKQVIVQKIFVKWKCEICGKEYICQEDAYTCEKIHKNKEALSKVEPKFKVGDVVLYKEGRFGASVEYIFKVVPVDDYDRWAYTVYKDTYIDTVEESELTFVCSKEYCRKAINDIKNKMKNQLGIPKKNVVVQLLSNGEFDVRFTMKDDKIPVIKQED